MKVNHTGLIIHGDFSNAFRYKATYYPEATGLVLKLEPITVSSIVNYQQIVILKELIENWGALYRDSRLYNFEIVGSISSSNGLNLLLQLKRTLIPALNIGPRVKDILVKKQLIVDRQTLLSLIESASHIAIPYTASISIGDEDFTITWEEGQ